MATSSPAPRTIRDVIGPANQRVLRALEEAARTSHRLLIEGETGTGKSYIARVIHRCGPRHRGACVAVNCAAIADGLFESEFFGHERGAFTGALTKRRGLVEEADGGTLILDEVSELTRTQQAKLLTTLDDGEYRRLGSADPNFADFRLISITNQNLAERVSAGEFRQDLFHRCATLYIRLQPLREQKDRLPSIIRHLLMHRGRRPSAVAIAIEDEVLSAFRDHSWPGNVRELVRILEVASTRAGADPIALCHVEDLLRQQLDISSRVHRPKRTHRPRYVPPADPAAEREAILAAIRRWGGNKTRAAKELGIPRPRLYDRCMRLGIYDAVVERRLHRNGNGGAGTHH